MLACWQCNRAVIVQGGGWICPNCGQHGPPFVEPVSPNWREASLANTPHELPSNSRPV